MSREERIELACPEGAPRLDAYLADHLPDFSRARIQGLIRGGFVRIDGRAARKASRKVGRGARLEVEVPPPEPHRLEPEDIPLDIRHEDEHLLVVNKPPGMVVHPGAGRREGTLVGALLYHCRGRLSGIGGVERPGIVHRLYKDTSGLHIVAKSDLTHRRVSEALKARRIGRRYLALVEGMSLADRLRDGPLPLTEALEVSRPTVAPHILVCGIEPLMAVSPLWRGDGNGKRCWLVPAPAPRAHRAVPRARAALRALRAGVR